MKLIIAGSRSFKDYALLERKTLAFIEKHPSAGVTVVSGMAPGADTLACEFAARNGFDLLEMPANWKRYGRGAGYKRNVEMAFVAHACIVFWDGRSTGTLHMMKMARKYHLTLKVVKYHA